MIEGNIGEIARICTTLAVQPFFQWTTGGARIVRNSVLEETQLAHVITTRSLRFALQFFKLRDRAFAGGNDHRRHRYRRHRKCFRKRWLINRTRCGHALAVAVTQIARAELHRRKAPKPAHVLHDHRVIEAVAVLEIRLLEGGTRLAALSAHVLDPRTDAARRKRQQHEHHQRDPEQGRHHEREAS